MSVQASYQPMSILTERKGRAGLNVPSRTQKEKRLNEEIWKKERMMNMNESTAGIFRRQRQLVVAVLTATLLATPLFTACDTGGEPQESPQGGGLPLSFLTTVEELRTRAELNTANLTTIGVFAYLTDGDFDQSTATPGFMFNQKVERAGNGSPWTYSPVKYWSNNTTDRLSFFAYAPYVDEMATGGSNPSFQEKITAKGFPALTYTVPSAEANQVDLLASVPLMNQTYQGTSGSIGLTMKHTLSKVRFSVKSEVGIKVTALSVNNAPAAATLTFNDDSSGWGGYSGTQTFTATLAGGGTYVTANAADFQTLATFFLLPNKASATFSITYVQDGEPKLEFKKSNIALPTSSAWIQGAGVNYQLDVKKDGSLIATVGQDWTSGSGGGMSGKEKGIASATDWVTFAKLWNANGLPTLSDGVTPDYSLYEDYGWYETEGENRVFTIKLTSSFVLTGVTTGELYQPVGTDSHPLTLPIDGQGWEISIDLQNNSQLIAGKYSGVVGYTQSGISNLRVVTIPGNSSTAGYSIESSGATYAGVLAGRVDGDMLNCSVELVKTTVINTNTSATNAMYIGGLVGYCNGNILNSAVYEGSSAASASVISFSKASAGSGIGGLAGGVASGKTVGNCYVQLSKLSNQGGDTPAAGWLAGSKSGANFSTCHYMTGNTATGCTPDDPAAGIVGFTDLTGLCASLNTEVDKHMEWARWKEVTATGSVETVELDLYR